MTTTTTAAGCERREKIPCNKWHVPFVEMKCKKNDAAQFSREKKCRLYSIHLLVEYICNLNNTRGGGKKTEKSLTWLNHTLIKPQNMFCLAFISFFFFIFQTSVFFSRREWPYSQMLLASDTYMHQSISCKNIWHILDVELCALFLHTFFPLSTEGDRAYSTHTHKCN